MKNIFNYILSHEKHLSVNGDEVIISGNTSKPAEDGTVKSFTITKDQLLYAALVKNASKFEVDHSNSYKPKNATDWKTRPVCTVRNSTGSKHCFVSSILKDYPGEGNWR